jgi:DNA-binding PadR family transcriptional regulator
MSRKSKPISQPVFLILLQLSMKSGHGYSLMKDIRALSGGRVKLSSGTMYAALRRLRENKWVVLCPQPGQSRHKRSHVLTPRGREALRSEIDRMRVLTQIAEARLGSDNSRIHG